MNMFDKSEGNSNKALLLDPIKSTHLLTENYYINEKLL
jgi:hypothetical protein